jgi:hypothetical protein
MSQEAQAAGVAVGLLALFIFLVFITHGLILLPIAAFGIYVALRHP